jgi:hypothetical protein
MLCVKLLTFLYINIRPSLIDNKRSKEKGQKFYDSRFIPWYHSREYLKNSKFSKTKTRKNKKNLTKKLKKLLIKKNLILRLDKMQRNTPFSKSENDKNASNFINPQEQLLTKNLKKIKTQKMFKTSVGKKIRTFLRFDPLKLKFYQKKI